MEGAAYLAQLQDDPELEAQFDQIVEVIAAAQRTKWLSLSFAHNKVGSDKNMMGNQPYTFGP